MDSAKRPEVPGLFFYRCTKCKHEMVPEPEEIQWDKESIPCTRRLTKCDGQMTLFALKEKRV